MKCVMGKILSPKNSFFRMLIEDEKIIALDNEKNAPQNAEVIELGTDEMLLPPLADCHTHFFQTGIYLGALALSDISTKTELLSLLRWTPSDRYRIGEIVWAYAFDPQDEMPSAEELQSVAPNVPIFLRRADGHSCSLSSSAMKMLPQKMRNESGIFSGKAQELVVEHFLKSLDKNTLIEAAFRVAEYAKNAGASLVHALVPFVEWAKILIEIADELPIDIEIFIESTDVEQVKSLGLRQIGGCLLLDGSFGSHTAAISKPYSDDPQNSGILYFSDDELQYFFKSAFDNDLSVAMHSIGDRAIEQFLNIAERISGGKILHRWRIEHSELISPQQIERAAKLGLTLSVQPAFEARWGGPNKLYSQRLGDRWRNTNPLKSEIEAEILLLGGSDSYITPIDPIAGIFAAMHHPNTSQKLGFSDALAMFSKNAGIWSGKDFGEFKIGASAKGLIINGNFDGDVLPQWKDFNV